MQREVLRMDQVTYEHQGVTELDSFSLSVWEGEILGLVPVNNYGVEALFSILTQNLPLRWGHVYYHEKCVNSWRRCPGGLNRISVIRNETCLAQDLTVADNIFVLRSGFRKWRIRPQVLERQLQPFLEEIGVPLQADAYIDSLSVFQRFVVELLKAVVAGSRLIVLENVDALISESELAKLQEILLHYAEKGIAFLYLSSHFEETLRFCHRTALMSNGRILKCVDLRGSSRDMLSLPCVGEYDRWVREHLEKPDRELSQRAALELRRLSYGSLQEVELQVNAGECVVMQDMDGCALGDFLEVLERGQPETGQLLVGGEPLRSGADRSIAIVQERLTQTMVFQSMSYMDNLCLNMDHRFPRIWLSPGMRRSIRVEYAPMLGPEVFDKSIDELTDREKYDLVFARLLLQRPKVVFLIHPFKKAGVPIRSHIWELIDRLLKQGIAVVILAVNLADSLALADRLIRLRQGRVHEVYRREDFARLPINTPWRYLYREKYPLEPTFKERTDEHETFRDQ